MSETINQICKRYKNGRERHYGRIKGISYCLIGRICGGEGRNAFGNGQRDVKTLSQRKGDGGMYGYNTAHYRDPTAWRAIKRLERWQKKKALESLVSGANVQDDKSYAKDTKWQEGAFTGE